jgi:DnaJ-class molecular chaperone
VNNFVLLTSVVIASSGPFVVNDSPDITAEIAVEVALDQFREPAPDKSVCRNCLGTGKIGDGVVVYDCPICNGKGVACEGGRCPAN